MGNSCPEWEVDGGSTPSRGGLCRSHQEQPLEAAPGTQGASALLLGEEPLPPCSPAHLLTCSGEGWPPSGHVRDGVSQEASPPPSPGALKDPPPPSFRGGSAPPRTTSGLWKTAGAGGVPPENTVPSPGRDAVRGGRTGLLSDKSQRNLEKDLTFSSEQRDGLGTPLGVDEGANSGGPRRALTNLNSLPISC